jgi:hypothetical protein
MGIPNLPVSMIATVRSGTTTVTRTYSNAGDPYDGFPYEFQVTLDITPLSTSEPPNYQFDASNIIPGMWLLQQTGLAYEIISVGIPSSQTEVVVTIKDVDLYNLYSDSSISGNNYPQESATGVIMTISEDGDPIVSALNLLSANLPSISYWFNDAYARFQYRNLIQHYYNFDPNALNYGSFNLGEVVYISQSGAPPTSSFYIVDDTDSTQVEKSFGIVSSVDQPEELVPQVPQVQELQALQVHLV